MAWRRTQEETSRDNQDDHELETRTRMLVESFVIHILGSVIAMAICFYIIYMMMRRDKPVASDPERVPFLQERYKRVTEL